MPHVIIKVIGVKGIKPLITFPWELTRKRDNLLLFMKSLSLIFAPRKNGNLPKQLPTADLYRELAPLTLQITIAKQRVFVIAHSPLNV